MNSNRSFRSAPSEDAPVDLRGQSSPEQRNSCSPSQGRDPTRHSGILLAGYGIQRPQEGTHGTQDRLSQGGCPHSVPNSLHWPSLDQETLLQFLRTPSAIKHDAVCDLLLSSTYYNTPPPRVLYSAPSLEERLPQEPHLPHPPPHRLPLHKLFLDRHGTLLNEEGKDELIAHSHWLPHTQQGCMGKIHAILSDLSYWQLCLQYEATHHQFSASLGRFLLYQEPFASGRRLLSAAATVVERLPNSQLVCPNGPNALYTNLHSKKRPQLPSLLTLPGRLRMLPDFPRIPFPSILPPGTGSASTTGTWAGPFLPPGLHAPFGDRGASGIPLARQQ